MSIRPPTKSFFDFNEIWTVSRRRWMMHDGMQYAAANAVIRSFGQTSN